MSMLAKFDAGACFATSGARDALEGAEEAPQKYLLRHVTGDWGDLAGDDCAANERAVREGGAVASTYTLPGGVRIWIVTEADRSTTTILLPEEA